MEVGQVGTHGEDARKVAEKDSNIVISIAIILKEKAVEWIAMGVAINLILQLR